MEVNCVNEKIKKYMAEILEKYTDQKDNLIAILNEVQEKYGYIPQKAQLEISEKLKIPMAEIYGVITFYSRFTTEPKGKYNISICLGTACFVKGSGNLLDRAKERLKLKGLYRQVIGDSKWLVVLQKILVLKKKLKYVEKNYKRDSLLFTNKAISETEYEKSVRELLQTHNNVISFEAQLTTTELSILQNKQRVIELSIQQDDELLEMKQNIISSKEKLLSLIKNWKLSNLLVSPIDGTISFGSSFASGLNGFPLSKN